MDPAPYSTGHISISINHRAAIAIIPRGQVGPGALLYWPHAKINYQYPSHRRHPKTRMRVTPGHSTRGHHLQLKQTGPKNQGHKTNGQGSMNQPNRLPSTDNEHRNVKKCIETMILTKYKFNQNESVKREKEPAAPSRTRLKRISAHHPAGWARRPPDMQELCSVTVSKAKGE